VDGMEGDGKSRFFLVKTVGGEEESVARITELRIKSSEGKIKVKSIIIPPGMKGTLIVEAERYSDVFNAFEGIKNFKRILPGLVQLNEIKNIVTQEKVEELNVGDIVEIIAGPFKGMKAKVVNIREKDEVVIHLSDASASPIPIVISKDYLRKA